MQQYLKNVQKMSPLIHNITNYVTVNDVANILLGIGASPIMADEPLEAEDITAICNGLNINIGTLHEKSIEAMLLAGKKANALGHIAVLDPVGAGASKLRTDTAQRLLKEVKFDLIKGNISEIKALFQNTATTKGVDAAKGDAVTEENKKEAALYIKKIAQKEGCLIAVTGAIDIISDGKKSILIKNGHEKMKYITGMGCMLSGVATAFLTANKDYKLEAASRAFMLLGIAGYHSLLSGEGNTTYKNKIFDNICHLTDEIIAKEGNYEII